MAGPSPRQSIYTIACRCGAYTAIHIRHFGRTQVCRACKNSYTVAWRKNPKTGQSSPVVIALAKTAEQHRTARAGEIVGWMVCSCGYKRPALSADTRKTIRCPGCDRRMFLERPRGQTAASPAPAGPPPAAPPPVPSRSLTRAKAEAVGILCSCGERLGLRAELVGHEARCPSCGQVMRLEGGSAEHVRALFFKTPSEPEPLPWLDYLDGRPAPASRKPPSGVLVVPPAPPPPAPAPAAPAPEPPPASSPPHPRPGTFLCPCGQEIELWATQPGKEFPCPACGRSIRLEKRRDPQTLVTMLLPNFSAPPAQPPPTAAPSPPASPEDPGPPSSKVYPAAPAAPVQEVICDCGEALVASQEDVGRHIQCPSCGVMMEVVLQRDDTLTVRVLGRLTEGTWSLEDFQ